MSQWNAVGIAALLIGISGGSWLASLWLWPYKTCSWCDGTGRSPGSNSKRHGLCWRCGGHPRKLRRGAKKVRRGLDDQ